MPPPTITLLSGSNNQSIYDNNAITQVQYTTTNATGVTTTGLPPGVNGTWTTNTYTLTGTPTTSGTFNYTVTTTNSAGCKNENATGTISVCRIGSTTWNTCNGITQISSAPSEKCTVMTHPAAVNACSAKGVGWRIPSRAEMVCMCQNQQSLPFGLDTNYYWTSEPSGSLYYLIINPRNCGYDLGVPNYENAVVMCVK
jgi:hypothetical protein